MLESTLYSQIAGISAVVGFLLLAHSHNRKYFIKDILKNGFKTEGTVVEISRNPGPLFGKEGEGFAPVVQYTNNSGNVLKHHSQTYRTPCKYELGQIIDIWFIHYKSRREAALADDQPGDLPRKLFIAGLLLLLLAAPKIVVGMFGLF